MTSTEPPTDFTVFGITKEFLETVFRQSQKDPAITVTKFDVSYGSNKGDNFASVVLGCVADITHGDGTEKKHHIVIKTPHPNPVARKMLLEGIIFKKEAYVYNTIFPKMLEVQEQNGGVKILPSVPNHHYSYVDRDNGFVILQDERPNMFKMANRRKGLDVDHLRLVLRELARLHSLSFFLKEKLEDTDLRKTFKELAFREPFYYKNDDGELDGLTKKFLEIATKTTSDIILASQAKDDVKLLARNLVTQNVTEQVQGVLSSNTEPFSVLCHGDVWVNNFLFKYDEQEKKPSKAILLDLQMMRYGSPALDLVYIFFTSTTQETRRHHLQELLAFYHSSLIESMRILGVATPELSLEELKDQYKKMSPFGFMVGVNAVPVMLGNVEDMTDARKDCSEEEAEEMMKNMDEEIAKIASNDFVTERLIGIFEDFIELTGRTSLV